jgi:hypothetical protein
VEDPDRRSSPGARHRFASAYRRDAVRADFVKRRRNWRQFPCRLSATGDDDAVNRHRSGSARRSHVGVVDVDVHSADDRLVASAVGATGPSRDNALGCYRAQPYDSEQNQSP